MSEKAQIDYLEALIAGFGGEYNIVSSKKKTYHDFIFRGVNVTDNGQKVVITNDNGDIIEFNKNENKTSVTYRPAYGGEKHVADIPTIKVELLQHRGPVKREGQETIDDITEIFIVSPCRCDEK